MRNMKRKRFLVEDVNRSFLEKGKTSVIEQSYLSRDEEELILRKITIGRNTSYCMVLKSLDESNEVYEIEQSIKESTYKNLKGGNSLIKISTEFYINGIKILLEQYPDGLRIITIDFSSIEESEGFISPTWFGIEVTGDIKYEDRFLWEKINDEKE